MNLFEIVGPAMIGPSSSHTAGAIRIGQATAKLLGRPVKNADVGLHGSFAATYKGHGSDRAIAGGLMLMEVDDPRIRDSLRLAEESGISINFRQIKLRGEHPNTVLIRAEAEGGGEIEVKASSIGGGSILITAIDGIEVSFAGDENTLIVRHRDVPGVIASVSSALAENQVNIATMKVSRKSLGREAIMVLELDALPSEETLRRIEAMRFSDTVTLLPKRR